MSEIDDEPRPCERCNAIIPAARVRALPHTFLCLECSEETGGETVLVAKQENLGKAGSLKLNYGGVSVTTKLKDLPKKV